MEPTIYALSRNMKNIRIYLSENFHLLLVKFSVYWNRHVFVMTKALVKVAFGTYFILNHIPSI